jgi:periplasmic divalent cation tolerance protein
LREVFNVNTSPIDLIELRVSCPDETTAGRIGRAAVEARLAACAHVAQVRSVYRWQGEVHESAEWTLTLRSRAPLFDRLAELIRGRHPYELPAIMSYPCAADDATAAWIAGSTP